MLASKNLLKSLISLLKSTDVFGSLLIEWNGKASRFQLKSKRKQRVYKARFLLSALYICLASDHSSYLDMGKHQQLCKISQHVHDLWFAAQYLLSYCVLFKATTDCFLFKWNAAV